MPVAVVTGATGITGSAMVHELLSDPKWTKIYTLSRSQPSTREDPRIIHLKLDLQSPAPDMASQLSPIKSPTHVFFHAYLARDDEAEAAKVNGAMLSNFLEALDQTSLSKSLKRFILTTGLKQYGVHLGQPKNPMHESDPWLTSSHRPPNFYYDQQNLMAKATKSADWDYVVTYPQDVIGVARANFMNLATALGLYSAVSSALPGSELPFPGNPINYLAFNCWTSARLHAEFCHWAALSENPEVKNQAFNVVNGDTESWQNLWPLIAKRFGCVVPETMFPAGEYGEYQDFEAVDMPLAEQPPIEDTHSTAMGMKGSFKQSRVHQQIDTSKWAKRPEVVEAYSQIKSKHGLDGEAWEKATWGFLTFLMGRNYSCVVSMSKARSMGWTGYRDTWEEFEHTFAQLEGMKILPPSKGEQIGLAGV